MFQFDLPEPNAVTNGLLRYVRMPISRREVLGSLAAMLLASRRSRAGAAPITMESLLAEMIDREVVARLPEVSYRSHEASSHDPRKVSPDDPSWFANLDYSQFIREENHSGRNESVMMDAEGPGVITRFWMGAPRPQDGPPGTIRIYLDGSDDPVIEQPADKLLSGTGLAGPPLSAVTSIGRNFYFPIPFASRCKVTCDSPNYWATKNEKDRVWYVIEYRTYPKENRVETFTQESFRKLAPLLAHVQELLDRREAPASQNFSVTDAPRKDLAPGDSVTQSFRGPGAVRSFVVRLEADDIAQALRSTVLSISFDGESTVWCPVGDFFGSGVGLNPYRDWWRKVAANGDMACFWVMPYQRECAIQLENLGTQNVRAILGPHFTSAWQWNERSLLFHSNWRQQYPLETKREDGLDWNFIDITGQGIYVGDTFAIHNGSDKWWGEGDEKIFVDGEKFPSHLGTGTEDYYGYSFGDRGVFFDAPFHAEPRADGNNKPGYTTNTRTRSLDAIPFTNSLRFDMEIWHWAQTTMAVAAATYWYARPGATCNRAPDPAGARKPVLK
jgi:hypothetical protein